MVHLPCIDGAESLARNTPLESISIAVLPLDVDGVLTDSSFALSRPLEHAGKRPFYRDLDALTKVRDAGVNIALVTGEPDGPLRIDPSHTVGRIGCPGGCPPAQDPGPS